MTTCGGQAAKDEYIIPCAMKKWEILTKSKVKDLVELLLKNRGLKTQQAVADFLHPKDPHTLTAADVGIDAKDLRVALDRIKLAIKNHESIVVYADYDADGVTAGAIMWEALYSLGAQVMPFIPHRVDDGHGLSEKGIEAVISQHQATLIITVDNGISAGEKIEYAKKQGIDVIVTDHHVKPKKLPDCHIVHTTDLCGAGVAWFVVKELLCDSDELLALAAIGTIADLVPLLGVNRSIVKYGLAAINQTERIGLLALIADSGLTTGEVDVYGVSHVLSPRLNAMGRLNHALDALRLLCTKSPQKAFLLAKQLGMVNKERQVMTEEMTQHAKKLYQGVTSRQSGTLPTKLKKIIFLAHESYNPGVIGLVAGRLVEEFYLPAIVVSKGELISKASARSIFGFNIIEAIRSVEDILVDAGGHPMAAGFTVQTALLPDVETRLNELADRSITAGQLQRTLRIDCKLPLELVSEDLWTKLTQLRPFGAGNSEPVFAAYRVRVSDIRAIGRENKHLKLRLSSGDHETEAVAFGFGSLTSQVKAQDLVDIAYTVDMNQWNGNSSLQLKLRDIRNHLSDDQE